MIMTPARFSKLVMHLEHLTDKQNQELQDLLSNQEPVKKIIRQLEHRLVEHPECPHCHSAIINRYGKN